jgi:hypothetical protein
MENVWNFILLNNVEFLSLMMKESTPWPHEGDLTCCSGAPGQLSPLAHCLRVCKYKSELLGQRLLFSCWVSGMALCGWEVGHELSSPSKDLH